MEEIRFRVPAQSEFYLLRVVLRPITLLLQLYYLLVVFRGYFGGGGLRYVC